MNIFHRTLWARLSVAIAMVHPALSQSPVDREIEDLVDTYHLAEQKKDLKWLDHHTVADFIWVTRMGSIVRKQSFLQRIAGGTALIQQAEVKSIREEQDIRVYGDTAIVTRITRREMPSQTLRFASTDVFVRRDGRWQLASSHSNVIPPADPLTRPPQH